MSQRTDLVLNQTLTNYAFGLAQDIRSSIADFLAPEAPVGTPIGMYKIYSNKAAFQIYSRARAVGGPARRVAFSAEDGTFNCKPNALEATIDDSERSPDGNDLNLEQSKVRMLVVNNVVGREYDVVAAAKAGVSAVAGVGNWSNANKDPIDELNGQIVDLVTACGGVYPGAEIGVLFGLNAWRLVAGSEKVKKYFPGASAIVINAAAIQGLLLLPVTIKIGTLSYDTTKLGQTKVAANIVGDDVFVFLRSQNPTVLDPSFMKVFTVRGGSITGVSQYRDNNVRSDVYAVDVSEDIKVTGSACAKRITTS
jgi:hypothetical protein